MWALGEERRNVQSHECTHRGHSVSRGGVSSATSELTEGTLCAEDLEEVPTLVLGLLCSWGIRCCCTNIADRYPLYLSGSYVRIFG